MNPDPIDAYRTRMIEQAWDIPDGVREVWIEWHRKNATDLDKLRAIVERIMTRHWDMASCQCWLCRAGREAGCKPRETYLVYGNADRFPIPATGWDVSDGQ